MASLLINYLQSNEVRDKKELQERIDQVEARLNIQIASLTENLNAAQVYAVESEKKAEESRNKVTEEEKKSDALRGEIAGICEISGCFYP